MTKDDVGEIRMTLAWIVLLAPLGGVTGFAGYIVASGIIEKVYMQHSGDYLTYTQQAGFIILPLCTLLGAAIGFSIAPAFVGRFIVSSILLIVTSLCGTAIVVAMWISQIATYGRDPSEVVLYYPPLCYCAAAFVVAVGMLAARAAHAMAAARNSLKSH